MKLQTTLKQKKDIDRINHLLTTGFSTFNDESAVNKEFNGSVKSIGGVEGNEKVVENTEVINGKIELTSETNETNMKALTENVQKCSIIDNTICTESGASDEQEESNYSGKSTQNNNTNISCDIVCINDIDSEKYKAEVHQFCQNLKSELSKFNNFLNEPTTVKHVAHLEIEASKKKELENIVAEFENKRISSPNPFSFVAELKTFIRNYDQQ